MEKKRVATIWHQNMEEIEAITPVDLLRRAGLIVDIFSADDNLTITGSHGIKLQAEKKLREIKTDRYAAIILIGGPGVDTLLANDYLANLTRQFHEQNKLIGAICAAPQVLGKAGIAEGLKLTHYPGTNQFLKGAIDLTPQPLVVSKNIITSAGPGTAFEYGLALIEHLMGKAVKEKVKIETVYQK